MKAHLPLTYENYIFDLYGTLVDIHTDENLPELWEKMTLFFGYYGAGFTPDELHAAWDALTELYRQEAAQKASALSDVCQNPGSVSASSCVNLQTLPPFDQIRVDQDYEASPEIDLTDMIHELYNQKDVAASAELAVHTGQFFRVLSTEYIRLYEGTVSMLERLHAKGKKVWLLSNAQRIFTQYELRLLDLQRHFDGILISSDYGVGKPNPFFFQQLTEQFGIDFKKSLFIGNDVVNDIGGARNVGLDSFYVHSNLSFLMPSWVPSEVDAASHAAQYRLDGTINYTVLNFTGWA